MSIIVAFHAAQREAIHAAMGRSPFIIDPGASDLLLVFVSATAKYSTAGDIRKLFAGIAFNGVRFRSGSTVPIWCTTQSFSEMGETDASEKIWHIDDVEYSIWEDILRPLELPEITEMQYIRALTGPRIEANQAEYGKRALLRDFISDD